MRLSFESWRDSEVTPSLIVWMSLQLVIPWQVALQQSPPPLHQPSVLCNRGPARNNRKRMLVRVNEIATQDSYSHVATGYHLLIDHELRWSRHYVFGGE